MVLVVAHRLEPRGRRIDVHSNVSARTPRNGTVPVTLTRSDDHGVAGFEIVVTATLPVNAHAALDDKEPLRTGMRVPVGSPAVGECHTVHADGNAGFVMGQPLDRRPAEEGCRIDRGDRRVT